MNQIPNRAPSVTRTFDPKKFKAEMLQLLGGRITEFGKKLTSCANDDQVKRMGEALERSWEPEDRKWLTEHNVSPDRHEYYIGLIRQTMRNGVNQMMMALNMAQ